MDHGSLFMDDGSRRKANRTRMAWIEILVWICNGFEKAVRRGV
jgi:hypothetical protein